MIAGHAWEIFLSLFSVAATAAMGLLSMAIRRGQEEERESRRRLGERMGVVEQRLDKHEGWHEGVRDERARRKYTGDDEE